MGKRIYRTYEIHNSEGLPIHVGLCRVHEQPLLEPDQTLVWLLGRNLPICASLARTFVRDRVRQISRWWETPDVAPPWLQTHIPIQPQYRGRGHGRPIVRIWPDGRTDYYPSVMAAAVAVGCARPILDRRLMDGRVDDQGCHWFDIDCFGRPAKNVPQLKGRTES